MSVTVRLFVSAKVVLDETVTKVSGGVVEGTIADRDLPFESASDTLTDESEEPLRAPFIASDASVIGLADGAVTVNEIVEVRGGGAKLLNNSVNWKLSPGLFATVTG